MPGRLTRPLDQGDVAGHLQHFGGRPGTVVVMQEQRPERVVGLQGGQVPEHGNVDAGQISELQHVIERDALGAQVVGEAENTVSRLVEAVVGVDGIPEEARRRRDTEIR